MLEEIGSKGNITVFKYGNKLFKVVIGDLQSQIDADILTKVDLNNLVGEIATTPVLVNRWGNIVSEVEYQLQVLKLEFDIWCSSRKEKIRNDFNESGKKFTIDVIEGELLKDKDYKEKKVSIFELEKVYSNVKSVYWSLKDKSDKLTKLSLTLQREDVLNMKTTVMNGISIIIKKPRIQEED
jgi:hypothetical protein